MKESRSRTSWFATLPGFLILFCLAVAAVYYDKRQQAVFLLIFTVLFFMAALWNLSVLKHISAEVIPICPEGHAGDRLELKFKVINKSLLPLIWMDIVLPVGKRGAVKKHGGEYFYYRPYPESEKLNMGLRERTAWLFWQQELSFPMELDAVKRGTEDVTRLRLTAGDGLGLSNRTRWLKLKSPFRIMVYPKLIPVRVQPFLKQTYEASYSGRGENEDITLLKSSRTYLPQDPAKRINWRLLAGTGRMEVNIYETLRPGCITFFLDLGSFRQVTEKKHDDGRTERIVSLREAELEEGISLIASCMVKIDAAGIPIALVLPGYKKRDPVITAPQEGAGEETLRRCMEELAMIGYQAEETFLPAEDFWLAARRLGSIYICSLSAVSCTAAALSEELGRSHAAFIFKERDGLVPGFDQMYYDDLEEGDGAQALAGCESHGESLKKTVAENKEPGGAPLGTGWSAGEAGKGGLNL